MQVKLFIDGVEVIVEVDTGATLSIMSQGTYERLWKKDNAPRMNPSNARLRTYTGEVIKVLGELELEVVIDDQRELLNLIVVEGDGPSLMGRDWLKKIKLDWSQLHQARSSSTLTDILDRYNSLFLDELGVVNGIRVKISMNSSGTICVTWED